MNYLVAVLADRKQAEAARSALEQAGIPLNQVSILGQGYKSADEFGLIDPKAKARQQSLLMAAWLVPFGLGAGIVFSWITDLHTFAWAGDIGDRAISGLLGAGSGALGSLFAGGGISLFAGDADTLPYRQQLKAGKYIIIVARGSENLISRASKILGQFQPENIQGYTESL